mgnify:CR=1 FL=1
MIDAMAHFQVNNALHRDLKLANIFLHFPDMVGKEDKIDKKWLKRVDLNTERFYIKIGDMGFSKI